MDNIQQDPYIGKIVMCKPRHHTVLDQFDKIEGDFVYYSYNSLFLVVGIKEKRYAGGKNDYYILKPLNNDVWDLNLDKQLVWSYNVFYVGVNVENSFQIVE